MTTKDFVSSIRRHFKFVVKKKGGRNNYGRMTVPGRGGGHKQTSVIVDYKRKLYGVSGRVKSIEYDSNRSAMVAAVLHSNFVCSYVLVQKGLQIEDIVVSSNSELVEFDKNAIGSAYSLKFIDIGYLVSNIEVKPGGGGKFCRSAGTYGQILDKKDGFVILKLPSGEVRLLHENCLATLGGIGNGHLQKIPKLKAGNWRHLGFRPKVRGVAKNPVDHPHGGGEGRTSGGRPSVTPNGLITKGRPTRKFLNKWVIKSRKVAKEEENIFSV